MSCWVNKQTQIRCFSALLLGRCPRPGLTGARAYSWKKADETQSPTAYYDILKVSPNATHAQIKSAYYKQSLAHHPDRDRSEDAPRLFALVSEAYSVLGNRDLRRRYDQGILGHDVHTAGRRSGTGARFDFDAFYQAHYGEQLQREQELKMRMKMQQQVQQERMRRRRTERATQAVVFLLSCAFIIVCFNI